MAVFSNLGFWLFAAALLGVSVAWGAVERRRKLYRAGFHPEGLDYQQTGKIIEWAAAIATMAWILTVCLGFWLFGWKIGLAAAVIAFVICTISS